MENSLEVPSMVQQQRIHYSGTTKRTANPLPSRASPQASFPSPPRPTLTSPAGQPRPRAAPLPRHVPHRNARAAATGGRGQRLLRQMARGVVARLRRSRPERHGGLPQLAAQERWGRAACQKRKRVLNGNPPHSKPTADTQCTASKGFGGWRTSERQVSSAGTAASGSSSAPSQLPARC
jgi:hypothetical protein